MASIKCKCGRNYIGDNTPAHGLMCMDCWTERQNRPAGTQQADTPPDRPGNPLATLDISEHFILRPFGVRMAEWMYIVGRYENIDND